MSRGAWGGPATAKSCLLVSGAMWATLVGSVSAAPVTLATPGGVAPGSAFRFLVVSQGTIDGSSSDIATYNRFVHDDAGGATYRGAPVGWRAIASTVSIDARTNVGHFGEAVPVFLVSGASVATDLTTNLHGLWGGSLLNAPMLDVSGSIVPTLVWTGSFADGTAAAQLGTLAPRVGQSFATTLDWLQKSSQSASIQTRMYGLSELLTAPAVAIPELGFSGIGGVLGLVTAALGLIERRRSSFRGS